MFRLATAPRSQGRQLLASFVPLVTPQATAFNTASTRTYAAKAKPRSPKAWKAPVGGERRPQEAAFKPRPLSAFQARNKDLGFKHVTAEEAHALYVKYLSALTVRNKPADWQDKFIRDNNVTAAALHETGHFIYTFPDMVSDEFHLLCSMMDSAAGLGHDAAALSLGRVLIKLPGGKDNYFHFENPRWYKTRSRCLALIKEGRSANALVLDGLIHLKRNTPKDYRSALQAFGQAEELSKNAESFDWQASCLEGQGEAYLQLGEEQKAEEAFVRLADLGYPQGYFRLAQLRPESPEYLERITKAAASGIKEAYEMLVAEHERRREVCRAEGRVSEAAHHERDAAEWTRLLQASQRKNRREESSSL